VVAVYRHNARICLENRVVTRCVLFGPFDPYAVMEQYPKLSLSSHRDA
jgi:hypothetical protein